VREDELGGVELSETCLPAGVLQLDMGNAANGSSFVPVLDQAQSPSPKELRAVKVGASQLLQLLQLLSPLFKVERPPTPAAPPAPSNGETAIGELSTPS